MQLGPLFIGRCVFELPVAALEGPRFDRIRNGFAQHYDVAVERSGAFFFQRGEGYLRLGRWDAFGYVDSGRVQRLFEGEGSEIAYEGNVILLPPRHTLLYFDLNIRVALIFWIASLATAWWFVGGDWLLWLILFGLAYGSTIALVRRSLRRKIADWLARESWN